MLQTFLFGKVSASVQYKNSTIAAGISKIRENSTPSKFNFFSGAQKKCELE